MEKLWSKLVGVATNLEGNIHDMRIVIEAMQGLEAILPERQREVRAQRSILMLKLLVEVELRQSIESKYVSDSDSGGGTISEQNLRKVAQDNEIRPKWLLARFELGTCFSSMRGAMTSGEVVGDTKIVAVCDEILKGADILLKCIGEAACKDLQDEYDVLNKELESIAGGAGDGESWYSGFPSKDGINSSLASIMDVGKKILIKNSTAASLKKQIEIHDQAFLIRLWANALGLCHSCNNL